MNTPRKLRCYLMGGESVLIQCADFLLQQEHPILGIISSDPAVRKWTHKNEIPLINPESDLQSVLSSQPFHYFFSIANLRIIPPEILTLPSEGAINFHNGPLPRYAGLNTPTWALINREKQYGITWHTMVPGVDEGDILKQRFFEITDSETAVTLNTRCFQTAIDTFPELIRELAQGKVNRQKQNLAEKRNYSKHQRPANASLIDWNQEAEAIGAFVRALDFGGYVNPMGLPKILAGGILAAVTGVEILGQTTHAHPGTVLEVSEDRLSIATRDGRVSITSLSTLEGNPLTILDYVRASKLETGDRLAQIPPEVSRRLTEVHDSLVRHEDYWIKKLSSLEPFHIPYRKHAREENDSRKFETFFFPIPQEIHGYVKALDPEVPMADFHLTAFGAWLARITGASDFDIGYSDASLASRLHGFEQFHATQAPVRFSFDPHRPFAENLASSLSELKTVRRRQTYARDVLARYPQLRDVTESGYHAGLPVAVEWGPGMNGQSAGPGTYFLLVLSEDGMECRWLYDPRIIDTSSLNEMQRQFDIFLRGLSMNPDQPIARLPILSEDESRRILIDWNATQAEYPREDCIHDQFEAQVKRTPDAPAVAYQNQEWTYRELNRRANQVAHYLRKQGVGPDILVGVHMERSLEMMAGLFGILKAGGAYVPLDPDFPRERLAFMVQDTRVPVLLTTSRLAGNLPADKAQIVCLDTDWETIARESPENERVAVRPEHLAYVIYTSGSTGNPKGVMLEHRNVINFFTGMDERLAHDNPGVWLAVTSLSFDISVLELFWTLARGFKVVLYSQDDRVSSPAPKRSRFVSRPLDFSLFYFSSNEAADENDKYRLMLEGAKFADEHGFLAVWTPERHFHAFGGLFPNPAVTGAALAAITRRTRIRSGSCVLPLHNPIRVAEEWAVVDNLSGGRVDLSVAAGWQPNDFVLRPENYASRKESMFRDIETLKRLWRGEAVPFPNPHGEQVPVRTLPRPIQAELPVWITTAGNPETYIQAAQAGANVLTHLLGQSIEQVAEKIEIYHKTWTECGHPGRGHVTLMLHTFTGEDDDAVHETVRGPMKEYLRSAMSLVKEAAWYFPTFQKLSSDSGKSIDETFESLKPAELDALLEFAFERYYEQSGLFGSLRRCMGIVGRLKEIGVDEIACLIDFGVPTETVLEHLPHLNQVREAANAGLEGAEGDYSIAALIHRHGVTHFQCTPSMINMLQTDTETREALRRIQCLMIGGEPLPAALANTLAELIPGEVHNMYGPTETTIWSSTAPVRKGTELITVGRPIANTQFYVVDKHLQIVPAGLTGELLIGGDGVARGYLDRPELTASRFIPNPFVPDSPSRVYRTGDVARFLPNGEIELLGRLDHQVKISGYRIELGEIVNRIEQHPGIREAVVVPREDTPGDKRLAAYLVPRPDAQLTSQDLRAFLLEQLPGYMVPAHFVILDEFPHTPNGKIDRKALPAPEKALQVLGGSDAGYAAPVTGTEKTLAAIWRDILKVPRVDLNDNFFNLGGHSLLAIQLIAAIRQAFHVDLPLGTLFKTPTLAEQAAAVQQLIIEQSDEDRLAAALENLDQLSDDEVRALLARQEE
ncbi:MAG: MupA/Atu3671 family FMN-dependent luciferase-like monooxygenase [bacterium]